MKWIPVFVVAIALNVFLVLWGRGGFVAVVLPMAASMWIGLPILAIALVSWKIGKRKNWNSIAKWSVWGMAGALAIFSTLLSIPAGKLFLGYDIREAQAYCETLVPELDRIKEQTGQYPHSVSGLLPHNGLPRLLRGHFYTSDGQIFSFDILDPSTIMGWVGFRSDDRRWKSWH